MADKVSVDGMDMFRKVLCLGSILCFGLSAVLWMAEPNLCEFVDLYYAIYAIMAVHLSVFGLTILTYVGCSWCIKKVRWWLTIYYAGMSGTMFYVQMIFF